MNSGIEKEEAPAQTTGGHLRVIQAILRDQTDRQPELLQEVEWLRTSASGDLHLQGNAFALEDPLTGNGEVLLLCAPPVEVRTSEWDLALPKGAELKLGTGEWLRQKYVGGKLGRIAAAHALQRKARPYRSDQDGLFLTNTWGDRSRDAHLSTEFMRKEIAAAAKLGADVVQIDDGWQKGITANSAKAMGSGAWDGFWASDPGFWDVHPERFPEGLEPLAECARAAGVRLGLWFGPDSSNSAANWRRDADALLRLHQNLGVDFFKIDALKITTPESESNFRRLFQAVREESSGTISFDFDITAEHRFGYFGLLEPGRLFLENRYTDWANYYPHQTLRAVWQLSHWIDPIRLRIEWLNQSRNAKAYSGDPLAPSQYSPDTLFAITMFCSPLGWFECQNLPVSYYETAAPLVQRWKEYREELFAGTVLPIGSAPDGIAWTGMISVDGQYVHAVVFRELNAAAAWRVELPVDTVRGTAEVLSGNGSAEFLDGTLQVTVAEKLGYLWVRISL